MKNFLLEAYVKEVIQELKFKRNRSRDIESHWLAKTYRFLTGGSSASLPKEAKQNLANLVDEWIEDREIQGEKFGFSKKKEIAENAMEFYTKYYKYRGDANYALRKTEAALDRKYAKN